MLQDWNILYSLATILTLAYLGLFIVNSAVVHSYKSWYLINRTDLWAHRSK